MGIFKLNKYWGLSIAVIIAISNGIIDHFFAPTGVYLLPVIIISSTSLINLNKEKFNILIQPIFTFILISLSDIGIKLYGGGVHDSEGQGFLIVFLFVGLLPGFIVLVLSAFLRKDVPVAAKFASVFLFLLLIYLYLQFLGNLGIGRSY